MTSFYVPAVAVYDKPYGKIIETMPEKSLPREQTRDGQQGVPVYDVNGTFLKIGLPGGNTGWITNDAGQLNKEPCKLLDRTTRQSRGAIGAGSSDVTCADR